MLRNVLLLLLLGQLKDFRFYRTWKNRERRNTVKLLTCLFDVSDPICLQKCLEYTGRPVILKATRTGINHMYYNYYSILFMDLEYRREACASRNMVEEIFRVTPWRKVITEQISEEEGMTEWIIHTEFSYRLCTFIILQLPLPAASISDLLTCLAAYSK